MRNQYHIINSNDAYSCFIAFNLFEVYAKKNKVVFKASGMKLQELFMMALKTIYVKKYFYSIPNCMNEDDIRIESRIYYDATEDENGNIVYNVLKSAQNASTIELFDSIIKIINLWTPYYKFIKSMELVHIRPQLKNDKAVEDRFNISTMKDLFMYVSAFYENHDMFNGVVNKRGINIYLSESLDIMVHEYINSKLNKEVAEGCIKASDLFGNKIEIVSYYFNSKDLLDTVNWIKEHKSNEFMNLKLDVYKTRDMKEPSLTAVFKRGGDLNSISIVIYNKEFDIRFKFAMSQQKFLEKANSVLVEC